MLIDTKEATSLVSYAVRLDYRAKLELACEDLAGYRDIDSYIAGAIGDQVFSFEIMRYSRWIGENNRICL